MARIALPDAPSVVAGHGRAAIFTADGELLLLPAAEAAAHLRGLPPPLLVHAPATFRRLGLRGMPGVRSAGAVRLRAARPAPPRRRRAASPWRSTSSRRTAWKPRRRCCPNWPPPCCIGSRRAATLALNRDAAGLAARMGQAGWGWAPFVTAALGRPDAAPSSEALRVWKRLPEWEDAAPLPPPSSLPVAEAEARSRLAAMLGPHAEQRPGQADYAGAAAAAFAPRETRGDPHLVLAEAGTGTGKTLGYLAPASLWAEKNHGGVWISTFTRHLQRQIDAELAHLFPDPSERHRRVVVRKGRENYLCLLNLEDALGPAMSRLAPASVIPLGLIARWALVTDDGDIQGGDLPGWLAELFGTADDPRPRRPARRVHPRRLPALAALLRRAHDPPRPHRAACRRQPCAGDDPGRVGRAGRQRRAQPATCSTRATTCSMRRTARSPPNCPGWRPPNCAAGCSAPRAGGRAPAACGGGSRNWSRPARCWRRRWTPRCRRRARCPRRAGPAASARIIRNSAAWMPAGPTRPRRSCG